MFRLRIPRYSLQVVLRRAALAYLIVWQLSPVMAYGTGWRLAAGASALLWVFLEMNSRRSVLLRPNLAVFLACVFVAYVLAIEFLIVDAPDFLLHVQMIVMLFILVIGESLSRDREGDAKFCFWLILLVLPIWEIGTLRGLILIDSHVARTVTRSSIEAMELTKQGVGGFSLVYSVLLCMPFLIWMSLNSGLLRALPAGGWQRRFSVGLIIVNAVLGAILVLRAGYAIAVLLLFSATACVLIIRSRHRYRFALSVVFAALLVVLGWLSVVPILDIMGNLANGTEYSAKVRDLRESFEIGDSTGTVEGRTDRYERSLVLFAENPVLGTYSNRDIGKHSAIIDRFAQYGFMIGSLFLFLLAYYPWRLMRDRRVPIGLALGFLVAAVGFPMLNNIFMSWGLMLYVFSRGALVVMGLPLSRVHNGQNDLAGKL